MCLVSDTPTPLESLIDRISAPTPPDFDDTATSLEALGHVGDAVKWFATVQEKWPPTPPQSVTVVALGDDSLRVDNSRYAIVEAPADALNAILAGASAVDSAVDSGADAIVLQDSAILAPGTLALVSLLTSSDAAAATLRQLDANAWMQQVSAVRDCMRLGRKNLGDAVALLDSVQAHDVAVMAGVLLAAAARRTAVILDSTSSLAAALVAHRISYRSREWWWASQRPADPAAHLALDRLDLHPFVDLHLVHAPGIAPMLVFDSLRAALTRI
jgi:NaMN:DMB phosphoribosyltransferase